MATCTLRGEPLTTTPGTPTRRTASSTWRVQRMMARRSGDPSRSRASWTIHKSPRARRQSSGPLRMLSLLRYQRRVCRMATEERHEWSRHRRKPFDRQRRHLGSPGPPALAGQPPDNRDVNAAANAEEDNDASTDPPNLINTRSRDSNIYFQRVVK